jgi:hypothetical protein
VKGEAGTFQKKRRASWGMACKNALVMFEEIPRAPELSQQKAIFSFGVLFVVYFASSIGLWFCLGHPLSVGDKIALGNFVLGSLFSGLFLSTAKSATPQDNHRRVIVLRRATLLGLLLAGVVQHALR